MRYDFFLLAFLLCWVVVHACLMLIAYFCVGGEARMKWETFRFVFCSVEILQAMTVQLLVYTGDLDIQAQHQIQPRWSQAQSMLPTVTKEEEEELVEEMLKDMAEKE
ncbi:hypothetical protein BU23DRAFT_571138 [Bimuria novae-zelandiae CBS 107.79]|uniref:Uncharacterized protein n=1 Tax=Bimuria novae-zelandiae CBS 107.79 TaxID=1447943 RepID=A0A6A5UXE9_9PLEO|nr:hypothetical protein BU23DRAFT_571138 [Bimuria novae-zelandiae CBS 107.79]